MREARTFCTVLVLVRRRGRDVQSLALGAEVL